MVPRITWIDIFKHFSAWHKSKCSRVSAIIVIFLSTVFVLLYNINLTLPWIKVIWGFMSTIHHLKYFRARCVLECGNLQIWERLRSHCVDHSCCSGVWDSTCNISTKQECCYGKSTMNLTLVQIGFCYWVSSSLMCCWVRKHSGFQGRVSSEQAWGQPLQFTPL